MLERKAPRRRASRRSIGRIGLSKARGNSAIEMLERNAPRRRTSRISLERIGLGRGREATVCLKERLLEGGPAEYPLQEFDSAKAVRGTVLLRCLKERGISIERIGLSEATVLSVSVLRLLEG
jgi:hypothetical protein